MGPRFEWCTALHAARTSPCIPVHLMRKIQEALAGTSEQVVVAGHSHLPMARITREWQILNPGSVGVPLDGEASASYMLLEGEATVGVLSSGGYSLTTRLCSANSNAKVSLRNVVSLATLLSRHSEPLDHR